MSTKHRILKICVADLFEHVFFVYVNAQSKIRVHNKNSQKHCANIIVKTGSSKKKKKTSIFFSQIYLKYYFSKGIKTLFKKFSNQCSRSKRSLPKYLSNYHIHNLKNNIHVMIFFRIHSHFINILKNFLVQILNEMHYI